ncbi:hypothetical protein [Aestuariibius sp. HNIBRBA575]|uniref:hypothetical protein n=1 Tax=Aestuariibius sp. HNIBRBA575 TaxID=3233343 RepID=UPI0034A12845
MMMGPDENGVYATLNASAGRRLFALMVLYALGALLIYLAFTNPPALIWQVFLIAFGAVVLFGAEHLRRATLLVLTLTEEGLSDSAGRVLARIEDIKDVERGVFAFKPSNGFTLVLTEKQPRAWAPGLYWALGRRVGVGGVTSAGASKFMAEQIAFRIASR